MIQHIDYTNANADVFAFDRGEGVKEYHAIMHVTDCRLTFHAQLDALMNAYQQLIEGELKGTVAVFKRYFLSDAANQADEVAVAAAILKKHRCRSRKRIQNTIKSLNPKMSMEAARALLEQMEARGFVIIDEQGHATFT